MNRRKLCSSKPQLQFIIVSAWIPTWVGVILIQNITLYNEVTMLSLLYSCAGLRICCLLVWAFYGFSSENKSLHFSNHHRTQTVRLAFTHEILCYNQLQKLIKKIHSKDVISAFHEKKFEVPQFRPLCWPVILSPCGGRNGIYAPLHTRPLLHTGICASAWSDLWKVGTSFLR